VSRWENNIKMNFWKIGLESVAEDKDGRKDFVNTMMKLPVS
jgi:hypothetical protein